MRACWLKWVGRDWSISADYIWLNYSDANTILITAVESMGFRWRRASCDIIRAAEVPYSAK